MKKFKIGAMLVVGVVGLYALVSYTIFYYQKSSIDQKIDVVDQKDALPTKNVEDVVIQTVCNHEDDQIALATDFVSNFEDVNQHEEPMSDMLVVDRSSFVAMPAEDCIIDAELLYTFDLLIGADLDEFVRLVLQSNNNIISKQACRSCTMYAFFNKIKRHEPLTVEDIKILQPLIENLYRFVEKMQKLSGKNLLRTSQFEALQDLNRSQSAKNDKKLQARKAATAAALKKLQSLSYR